MPSSVYIALNLFNNEDIMTQLRAQLVLLSKSIGTGRVYVSVFENGSRDGTKAHLAQLALELDGIGVKHTISTHDASWRAFCDEAILPPHLLPSCKNETAESDCPNLRDCPESIRIPLMAAFRNRALLPLFNAADMAALHAMVSDAGDAKPPSDLSHLGLVAEGSSSIATAAVVFLNDVLLRAEDVLQLMATQGGMRGAGAAGGADDADAQAAYDMACATDYELLKLYDVWVARDLNGNRFSDWYPYAQPGTPSPAAASWQRDAASVMSGRPFRVYSCWNGAVVVRAQALMQPGMGLKPIIFRSWRANETRSIAHGAAEQASLEGGGGDDGLYSEACPASECALICADLWSAGYDRIYINPAVKLYYNAKTQLYQQTIMAGVNTLVSWWLRSKWAVADSMTVGWNAEDSTVQSSNRISPPATVACGNNN